MIKNTIRRFEKQTSKKKNLYISFFCFSQSQKIPSETNKKKTEKKSHSITLLHGIFW